MGERATVTLIRTPGPRYHDASGARWLAWDTRKSRSGKTQTCTVCGKRSSLGWCKMAPPTLGTSFVCDKCTIIEEADE